MSDVRTQRVRRTEVTLPVRLRFPEGSDAAAIAAYEARNGDLCATPWTRLPEDRRAVWRRVAYAVLEHVEVRG